MKKFLRSVLGLMSMIAVIKAHATNGIYLVMEGGWAEQTGMPTQQQINASSVEQTNTPTALRGSIGYTHDFNQRWGVGAEAAMGRFGETTYHFVDAEDMRIVSDTVEFLATTTIHLRQFDLFAKIGGLRLTPAVSGTQAAESHTTIDGEGIVGAAYNFSGTTYPFLRYLAVTLSYETTVTNTEGAQDLKQPIYHLWGVSSSVDAVLLGLRYTFGP